MSGEPEYPARDPRIERVVHEFRQLSPEDQELVQALIGRLAGSENPGFAPDVPFMDFDE